MPLLQPQAQPLVRPIPLNLAGPAYTAYSGNVNSQTCINWYPQIPGPEGRSQAALFPTAGTDIVASVGGGNHRGAIEHKGNAYFLSGNSLVRMDTTETFTTMAGTTTSTTGKVSMASNGAFGNQVIIVDGSAGYTFNGATVTIIGDVDFPANPTTVRYMDARAIVTVANSGVWYISDSNDFTSWTATQFANAERDPDNLIACEVNNRDLMLFGDFTTEVGTNTGASPFPFEMYGNGLFDKGCAARFSIAKADDFVYWLSKDRRNSLQVLKARGISYSSISSKALEQAISTYTTVSDAEAFCYSERGTPFYQLTFPSQMVTWVCNLEVAKSNPEYAWVQKQTNATRHIASTYLAFNGKQYVGSYIDSILYRLSASTYTDGGDSITRERTSAVIAAQGSRNRLAHRKIELEFEAGTGLVSGQGSDPQVALDWSDDGGKTFSNSRTTSIGQIGQYTNRVLFHHLGMSRNRIYRVRVSDPVKYVLLEGYVHVEEMAH